MGKGPGKQTRLSQCELVELVHMAAGALAPPRQQAHRAEAEEMEGREVNVCSGSARRLALFPQVNMTRHTVSASVHRLSSSCPSVCCLFHLGFCETDRVGDGATTLHQCLKQLHAWTL